RASASLTDAGSGGGRVVHLHSAGQFSGFLSLVPFRWAVISVLSSALIEGVAKCNEENNDEEDHSRVVEEVFVVLGGEVPERHHERHAHNCRDCVGKHKSSETHFHGAAGEEGDRAEIEEVPRDKNHKEAA